VWNIITETISVIGLMKPPKVSVVVTTYNRPDLLPQAIESVTNQTYENIECFVVDDHSTVGNPESITKTVGDENVTYVRHSKNRGLSAARNTGIKKAGGKYIAFLDDDDRWESEKIEKQVSRFEKLSDDVAIVYCWMNYVDEESGRMVKEYKPTYKGYIFPETLDAQPIGSGSTLLIRVSVAEEVNGFDESLSRGIDGDFIRRVCKRYKVDYVPEFLVNYRVNHGNERITSDDKNGTKNAIEGHKRKICKFEKELEGMPEKYYNINKKISLLHAEIGNIGESLKYMYRAAKTKPFKKDCYIGFYSSVKISIENILGRYK